MEAVHIDNVCVGDSLVTNLKRLLSLYFIYLHVFVFQPCFALVFYHFSIIGCMCLYFTMAVIDQRFNSIYSSSEKLRKGDFACYHFCNKTVLPHQCLFPPQLSATHFENGQISTTRSLQNVRSDGQKLHRQWQESTEAVELENFR